MYVLCEHNLAMNQVAEQSDDHKVTLRKLREAFPVCHNEAVFQLIYRDRQFVTGGPRQTIHRYVCEEHLSDGQFETDIYGILDEIIKLTIGRPKPSLVSEL